MTALLTVDEAAGLLRVDRATIYRWIHEQGLPVFRLPHRFRFEREELLAWARGR